MIRGVRSLLDEHDGSLHQPDDLTMICLRAAVAEETPGLDAPARTSSFPHPGGPGLPAG